MSGNTVRAVSSKERDAHIESCAWLMERAWNRWERYGCFDARGEAERWRILMEEAIKDRDASRTPEEVAQIEQARGLA